MKCNHDCFTCPYPDCIKDNARKGDSINSHKKYYLQHRGDRLSYQKAYNAAHKEELRQKRKEKWANMTPDEREKERERQRANYLKRKEKNNVNV